jgi:hypothetical protein
METSPSPPRHWKSATSSVGSECSCDICYCSLRSASAFVTFMCVLFCIAPYVVQALLRRSFVSSALCARESHDQSATPFLHQSIIIIKIIIKIIIIIIILTTSRSICHSVSTGSVSPSTGKCVAAGWQQSYQSVWLGTDGEDIRGTLCVCVIVVSLCVCVILVSLCVCCVFCFFVCLLCLLFLCVLVVFVVTLRVCCVCCFFVCLLCLLFLCVFVVFSVSLCVCCV